MFETVEKYMMQPPSAGASNGGNGLVVEFPFGESTSLCKMTSEEVNPNIGRGLMVLQCFPMESIALPSGVKLCLEFNQIDLYSDPVGYGMGSYCYRDGLLQFVSFYPNAAYRPNLLPNLYYSCAERARKMSVDLLGEDWTPDCFEKAMANKMKRLNELVEMKKRGLI